MGARGVGLQGKLRDGDGRAVQAPRAHIQASRASLGVFQMHGLGRSWGRGGESPRLLCWWTWLAEL